MNDVESLFDKEGQALLFRSFVEESFFEALRDGLNWEEETIVMFGKPLKVPRLVAYYGDYPYTYAGVEHPAVAMPDVLSLLCKKVERVARFSFNSVVCNFYRDEMDSMGYHRDNEPEMDTRCIASLSFGAPRRFRIRHRKTKESFGVDLGNGDLLLMINCQEHWEHCIAKTKRPKEGRINLTYRRMMPRGVE